MLTQSQHLTRKLIGVISIALICVFVAAGCGADSGPTAPAAPRSVPTATLPTVAKPGGPTAVAPAAPPPSAAAAPSAAAIVNGTAIPLAAYQLAVDQGFHAQAQDQNIDPNSPQGQELLAQTKSQVLDGMIDDVLIAQEAAKEGVAVSEADLNAAMQGMITDAGGQAAFDQSLVAAGQTLDDARTVQRTQMLNNLMRDRVLANVPTTAEQVHARHILVDSQAAADALLAQLKAGADFVQMAQQSSKDSMTSAKGGDMDWFPRGWLPSKEVEDAAFALQPGQISGVVHSAFGFHIIQVIERDPNRALPPEKLLELQKQAIEKWLAGLRAAAKVERLAGQ